MQVGKKGAKARASWASQKQRAGPVRLQWSDLRGGQRSRRRGDSAGCYRPVRNLDLTYSNKSSMEYVAFTEKKN